MLAEFAWIKGIVPACIVAFGTIVASIISVAFTWRKRRSAEKQAREAQKEAIEAEERAKSWKSRAEASQTAYGYGLVDQETDFLNSLRLDEVNEIRILAHTGRVLVEQARILVDRLKAGQRWKLRLKVLLRDPLFESPRRRNHILRSCENLLSLQESRSDIECEVRFYTALQTLRGVVVSGESSPQKDCLISAYRWTAREGSGSPSAALVTQALPKGMTWSGRPDSEPEIVKIFENWFDYLWGPGILHTVAFDFDDTLLKTFDDHMESWARAVEELASADPHVLDRLTPDIGVALRCRDELLPKIESLFVKHSDALEMASEFFVKESDQKLHRTLNGKRSVYRRAALMGESEHDRRYRVEARRIPYVKDAIDELREKGYAVSVASLTDEKLINSALRVLGLEDSMSSVVGRSDYSIRILKDLSAKAHLIFKVAALAGMPPHRVLFIGDHRNDLNAAEQVGAAFVEARLVHAHTHIYGQLPKYHILFDNYKDMMQAVQKAELRAREGFLTMLEELQEKARALPKPEDSRL